MHRLPTLCLALLLAAPARAADPMSGAEFEAFVAGKTLDWVAGGTTFGTEQYLPDRRVLWKFTGETCETGTWTEKDGQICFTYPAAGHVACWLIWPDATAPKARQIGDPLLAPLSELHPAAQPLDCTPPGAGV